MTMWTDPRDIADQDTTDARPTPDQRVGADRQIRRRRLCDHGGYAGTDPITGVILCAICRRRPAALAPRTTGGEQA